MSGFLIYNSGWDNPNDVPYTYSPPRSDASSIVDKSMSLPTDEEGDTLVDNLMTNKDPSLTSLSLIRKDIKLTYGQLLNANLQFIERSLAQTYNDNPPLSSPSKMSNITPYEQSINANNPINEFEKANNQFQNFINTLRYNETLKSLNLSGCKINNSEFTKLCNFVAQKNALTSLDVSNNEIGHMGLRHLAYALGSDTVLAYLSLWGNKLGKPCDPDSLDFEGYNSRLYTTYAGYTEPQSRHQTGTMQDVPRGPDTLVFEVYDPGQYITYAGPQSRHQTGTMQDVINSMSALGSALGSFYYKGNLKYLELGNNQLGYTVLALSAAIKKNKSIAYLGLSQNNIPPVACGGALAESLFKTAKDMNLAKTLSNSIIPRVVDLSKNERLWSGALELVKAIEDKKTPMILNLSNCNFREGDAQKIRDLTFRHIVYRANEELNNFFEIHKIKGITIPTNVLDNIAIELLFRHFKNYPQICASLKENPGKISRQWLSSVDDDTNELKKRKIECDISSSQEGL